ncbi:MAG: bifunctional nicotinamidase/pyrazinamidase [Fidelibacterota bacterium]
MNKKALVIVDVQNDFCPGGALAVTHGDHIIPVVNNLIKRFTALKLPIFATRDWHPPDHCSFQSQGGPWPPHCIQGTEGALFHPELQLPQTAVTINKGTSLVKDAYSGFENTSLLQQLQNISVDEIVVCGLATDYCVKATVLDGLKARLEVTVCKDGIQGVNLHLGDDMRALNDMANAGANIKISDTLMLQ